MSNLQLWLFDEPPVTRLEVEDWTRRHARLEPGDWRFEYYTRHWNVADKIRDLKRQRLLTENSTRLKGVGTIKAIARDPPHRRRLSVKKAR